MMWTDKHRPRRIQDMVGNEEARAAVVEWFAKWRRGTRALLLVGPPGTGKTTAAWAGAAQFGYDMVEINASDVRSKSRINAILRPVLANTGLAGRSMIFVDEADGMLGRSDYGGADALASILAEPVVPIVLAANSDSAPKMRAIRKACKTVGFRPVPPRLLRAYVEDVAAREGADLGPGSVINIVSKSRGDMRALLNSAQELAGGFAPDVARSERALDAEQGVEAFFAAGSAADAYAVLNRIRGDPRERISAFYASVATSALPPDRAARMMEVISRADMIYGRIMRTQQWRLLRYLNAVLCELFEPGSRVRPARFSISFPLMNRIRWDGRAIKNFARSVAPQLHMSASHFAVHQMPYMLACMKAGARIDVGEEHAAIAEKEAKRL